ncbi:SURF1 family cytochrome oxidase biogenesis protein [Terricaulis sp.]|uniref:SURF1 family cytochrome oxidase biogenesis protein n=1 Tax=Terricaulis sp. TaxID=2768686 RepID=UPI0037850FCC
MIRFRPLWLMTVLTLFALALLIWLGRWQWDRYETKRRAATEPVAEMTIAQYTPIPEGIQFVNGIRPDTHESGWRVFAPVQYGDTVVFVDSDWISGTQIPNAREVRFPAALRLGSPINGASIRPEPPAPLTLAPRPLQRLWFAIDLAAMGRNAGLDNVADYYIAGTYVGEDGRATRNPFALAPGADVLPPARHLGYALTWYGLALVLLGIYFAYHISVGRLGLRPPRPPED